MTNTKEELLEAIKALPADMVLDDQPPEYYDAIVRGYYAKPADEEALTNQIEAMLECVCNGDDDDARGEAEMSRILQAFAEAGLFATEWARLALIEQIETMQQCELYEFTWFEEDTFNALKERAYDVFVLDGTTVTTTTTV